MGTVKRPTTMQVFTIRNYPTLKLAGGECGDFFVIRYLIARLL